MAAIEELCFLCGDFIGTEHGRRWVDRAMPVRLNHEGCDAAKDGVCYHPEDRCDVCCYCLSLIEEVEYTQDGFSFCSSPCADRFFESPELWRVA